MVVPPVPKVRTSTTLDTAATTPREAATPTSTSEASGQASLSCTPSVCRTPRGAKAAAEGTVRVRVAARVRPLLPFETVGPSGATDCIEVSSQALAIGKNCFTFDHAFPSSAPQEDVYRECVEPLVEATLEGINGTLLAYGQTGSGKTYTMGTSGSPSEPDGALQRAMRAIFDRAQERDAEGSSATSFRVSYVEIFTDASRGNSEEIRDLLNLGHNHVFATIKTDIDGQVKLEGILEHEVWTAQEAFTLLNYGSTCRATCSTRMNDSSSRSHALFALEVMQRRLVAGVPSTLTAKFQFVDLAGSEKVKLSGVEGEQLSQAININHGLFVLGRVITALTEGHQHVPFRESKLTRILQNSLGGNSRTCMIACVSPSDANIADSISTLTYAAKAKEITNKPVVNRGSSCPNCAQLQVRLEQLEAASAGEAAAPRAAAATGLPLRRECLHDTVVELERESARLRRENRRLAQEAEARSGGGSSGAGRHFAEALSPCSAGSGEEAGLDERELRGDQRRIEAEQKAAKAEALFVKCSERLAALQEAARSAELNVDESLLTCPTEAPNDSDDLTDLDVSSDFHGGSVGSVSESLNLESHDLTWLEQEASRKHRLLLKVEENHQAMAAMEAQSEERIRQHEAHRDILERELARLQSELEAARSREEHFSHIQECYDRRLASLQERNVALERERRESQRLKTLQRKQETRLKVLQDSIRDVKTERDQLKNQLAEEVKRRKEQEIKDKKEKSAAQEKIRCLNARVAALGRGDSPGPGRPAETVAPGARQRRGSETRLSRPGSVARAHGLRPQAGGGVWEQLLRGVAERAARERQLALAQAKLGGLEAQALELAAQRERLNVAAEVEGQAANEGRGNSLASLQTEALGLKAALEYQGEQVWMLRQELEGYSSQDPAEAAARLAEGLEPSELSSGLSWLCSEASRLQGALASAQEAQEAAEAEVASCRAAAAETRRQAAKQEHANDLLSSDYESRVAGLLHCFAEGAGAASAQGVEAALGEDPTTLLARRVSELEGQLSRERVEARERGQQRLEKDMELITSFREKDSENRLLHQQLGEATAKAERAITRGAQREAQLKEQLAQLEAQLAARETAPAASTEPKQATTAETSWGLQYLEDFWRSTGLTENREELVESIRQDVEAICKQRLHDHLEWKRELEEKIERMRGQLREFEEALGERADLPPEGANLLQAARVLEVSLGSQQALKEERSAELLELADRILSLRRRLRGDAAATEGPPVPAPEAPRALRRETLEEVRRQCRDLEALERERQALVAGHTDQLQGLWEEIGFQVPEELEEQEAALLQEPVPVSDACLAYLELRQRGLAELRGELERRRRGWQERLTTWQGLLAPFALALPEAPPELPLLRAVEGFETAVADTERAASDFAAREREALQDFQRSSLLRNVAEACSELDVASSLPARLQTLGSRWERLSAQRLEHQRIAELIAAREALETELRQFDAEASDPARFKKRGYSGVLENKRRSDYQRHLRMLDSSLVASTSEWAQREGMIFCIDGSEYRGAEMLPSEHTHMYAWTNKQLAQKQASRSLSGEFQPPARGPPRGAGAANPCSPGRPALGRARSPQSHAGSPGSCGSPGSGGSPGEGATPGRRRSTGGQAQPPALAARQSTGDAGRRPSASRRLPLAGTSPTQSARRLSS